MKTCKLFTGITIAGLLILIFLSACKKKRAYKEEDGQVPVDVTMLEAENDAALSSVNVAIMDHHLLRGRSSAQSSAQEALALEKCGLTVDTTKLFSGIVTLNYSGEVCSGRKKEGKIRVNILNYPLKKWKQKGCVIN